MKNIVFIILSFSFFISVGAENIHFKHINTDDGLSQVTIHSIYQDDTGTLWFGSSEGLNRYNGNKIDVFAPSVNGEGLTRNKIEELCGDSYGNIYIRSFSELIRFNAYTEKFVSMQEKGVSTITVHADTLWIGSGNTLSYYAAGDTEMHEVAVLEEKVRFGNSLIVNNDYIWVRHAGGVSKISRRDYKVLKNYSINNASLIYEDIKSNLWVGTIHDGLICITESGEKISYSVRNGLSNNYIKAIIEDNSGDIWVGTFNGLNHLSVETEKWTSFRHHDEVAYSLSHNSVNTLYKDKQGNIWAGTYFGGVNYFNPNYDTYMYYGCGNRSNKLLSSLIIGEMVEDKRGNLWICTEGGGLNMLDMKTGTFKSFPYHASGLPGKEHNNLKCIYYSSDKEQLYIGTHTGGVAVFDIASKRFKTLIPFPDKKATFAGNIVNRIQKYHNQLVLLTQAGVRVLDPTSDKFSPFTTDKTLKALLEKPFKYSTFYIDSANRMWLALSKGGALCINLTTKEYKNYQFDKSDSTSIGNFPIVDIMETSDKKLYFGTQGAGLFRYNEKDESFIHFQVETGSLSSNYCFSLYESPQHHHLFILHEKGFSVFDKDSGKAIGLYNLYNMGYNISSYIYHSSSGRMYIGGVQGMISFTEDDLYKVRSDYDIYFDRLWVNNTLTLPGDNNKVLDTPLFKAKEITLQYNQNNLSVEVCSSDYTQNRSNSYMYKLEGFSSEWIPVRSSVISYTNLNSGDYKLMVKERSGSNLISLDIHVVPPIYATIWAYLFYVVCILVVMQLIIWFRIRQSELKSSLDYERKEKERIEELNQLKFKFFTNVSHEFRTPLTLIIGQIEILLNHQNVIPAIYNKLVHVYRNALHMRGLISELLDFRKLEQGHLKLKLEYRNIVPFVKEIFIAFNEYRLLRNINYQLDSIYDEINIWFDPVQLQKVLYNLISNAFKYTSDGGEISVCVTNNLNNISISVKDTGKGIPQDEIEKIFERFYQMDNNSVHVTLSTGIGLELSKEIIELHHGIMTVKSEVSRGSEFIITLQKGNAHFSKEEMEQVSDMPASVDTSIMERAINNIYEEQPNTLLQDMNMEEVEDKYSILIVEDNNEMLDMLNGIFNEKFTVFMARNGKEGLDIAYKEHPTLIISDVMMPVMSGKEMCYKLKNSIELSHIPVILLTAQISEQYTIEGYMFGADDYITKPFSVNVLVARCINLIKSREKLFHSLHTAGNTGTISKAIDCASNEFIKKATKIVKDNLSNQDFDVALMASELGLGRSRLFTKMKELTGLTPNEFTLKIKLDEAMYLLKNSPDMNISEISFQLGFSSPRYFSKCFKDFYGVAPMHIRKG